MSFLQVRTLQNPLGKNTFPTVTTQAVLNISGTTADGNGTLVSTGSSTITARGFVYSSSVINPTLADSVAVEGGTGTGTFTKQLTGLSINTTYYVRAYATNAIGTGYGDAISFTTAATSYPAYAFFRMMGVGS